MNIPGQRFTSAFILTTLLFTFSIQPAFSITAIATKMCEQPSAVTLSITTERDFIPVSMSSSTHRDGDAIDVNAYHPIQFAQSTEVIAELSIEVITDFNGPFPFLFILGNTTLIGPEYCDFEGLATNSYGIPVGIIWDCAIEFEPVKVSSSIAGAFVDEMDEGEYTLYRYDEVTPPLGFQEHKFTLTTSASVN